MYKFILPLLLTCTIIFGCGKDKEVAEQQQLIESTFEMSGFGPHPMNVSREEVADRHDQVYELSGLLVNTGELSAFDYKTGIREFPRASSTPGSGYIEDTASGNLYHVTMFMGHPSLGDRHVMIAVRSGDSLIVTRYSFEQAVTFPTGEITQTIVSYDQTSVATNKVKALATFDEDLSALIRLAKDYKYKAKEA